MSEESPALYRRFDLAARLGVPFLLVGSEEAADAAHKLLGTVYVAVACPEDYRSAELDLSPLEGRQGLLIPTAGRDGRRAMKYLANRLLTICPSLRWTEPKGMPDGWTLADWKGTGDEFRAWAKDDRTKPYERTERRANGSHVLGEIFYRYMSEVEARPIDWLWPGRIAKGKVSMIVGNPGLGKSQVCASLASVVSNGGAWPVDRTTCAAGAVVILSAEDDAEDTIRPRLEAAGADLDRIVILEAIRREDEHGEVGRRGFDLTLDVTRLAALIAGLDDPALVIIDPITAYMGDADSHKNAEVRAVLAPVADMAAKLRVAVIAVSHLTKSASLDVLLRVQGSIGFAAAARAIWGVARDKDNPSRRLFMPLKNNLGVDNTGFAYTVDSIMLPESEIQTSHVVWESALVMQSADDVFGGEQTHEERRSISDAKEFLRSLLSDGPLVKNDIQKDADGAGHSWATIRRAQVDLGIVAFKEGFRGPWKWRMP